MGPATKALTALFAVALMLGGVFLIESPVPSAVDSNHGADQLLEAQKSLATSPAAEDPTAPSVRWGPMMVWDPVDQYVLLFGGSSGGNETWKFVGGHWTELHPSTSPSTRAYGGIAYDPQLNLVVLFGGRHVVTIDGTPYTTELNDTWTYVSGVWTNITLSAGPGPAGRESMGFTYDSYDAYLLLFGGVGQNNVFLNDTWALEDGKWIEISAIGSPPIRYALAMVFDAADGYVLLYGGIGQVGTKQPYYNETWSYQAGVWTNITYLPAPTGRAWTMLAYYGSGTDGYVMEFGGQANHQKTPTTAQNTTYRYSSGVWTRVTPAHSPCTRFGGGMAYDPVDGYMVLFGGLNATTVIAHALNDTWVYSAGVWTNVTVTPYQSYPVTFTESGLPSTNNWYVNVTNGLGLSASGTETSLVTNLSNGSYTFVTASSDRRWAPAYTSQFLVSGEPVPVSIAFSLLTYPITFTESGLPSCLTWSVMFNGTQRSLLTDGGTDQLGYSSEPNGSYPYAIAGLGGWEQNNIPYSGTATVDGQALNVALEYAVTSYAITFRESGLPSGLTWAISLNRTLKSLTTDGGIDELSFSAPNGTQPYSMTGISGWHQSTLAYAGFISVNSATVTEPTLAFTQVEYSVRFTESGLPLGTNWSVAVNGVVRSSAASTIIFIEANESCSFRVGAVSGYSSAPSAGMVSVIGAEVAVAVTFSVSPTLLGLPVFEGYAVVVGIVAFALIALLATALHRRRRRLAAVSSRTSPPPTSPPGST